MSSGISFAFPESTSGTSMLYPYRPQWQPPRKLRPAHVMIFGLSELSLQRYPMPCEDRLVSSISSKAINNEDGV